MLTINLNLPPAIEQQLERDLKKLEVLTNESRNFHIEKAIVRYLEYADKIINHYEQEKAKGKINFTAEELLERLNLKEVD